MNELKQGSSQWLELRKQYVTATDSAVILGLSPYKTQYKLWRQKMDLDTPDVETERMREGTRLEPLAREWIEKRMSKTFTPKVVFKDFMMSSLDGLSKRGEMIIEIKCGSKSFSQAEDGEISRMYICQMQHQMHCAEVDHCLYVAFNGERGIIIPVERDQNFINQMIEKEREFYECLISFTPPQMTTKDYHQRSDQEWNCLAENYRNAYQDLKRAEQLEKDLRKELISLAGEQSSQGAGIKLSKIPRKGMVDYSIIPELCNVDLEQYRKQPIEYWKLSVNE